MKAMSLFSGVGGFEIGFERAGIETVLQAEQDPWCRAVLARHWPDVERVSDVRDVAMVASGQGCLDYAIRDIPASNGRPTGAGAGSIDLVFGGFPCQPFSVAGGRAGDRDSRNLWPEFQRVLSELRPRWVVAENVPGLLSIDQGRFFGAILDDLGELGFAGVSYAVLDAQHFGVPQRRRRVFIVGGPDRRACEQVLALCESCGGYLAARRAAREVVAYTLAASARGTGDGHGNAWNSNYVTEAAAFDPRNVTSPANQSRVDFGLPAPTLHAEGLSVVERPLTAPVHGQRNDAETENLIADTVRSHPRPGSNSLGNVVAFDPQCSISGTMHASESAVGALTGAKTPGIAHPSFGVRRLTPMECERLMGWGEDWTRWTNDGREVSDSIRYRMIGNGVASPVAEWIGRRLVWVDAHRGVTS